MSAFVIHQPTTQPQIIDSRGGLFWCKTGWLVHAGKMNIYFKNAICTSHLGYLVQNALQFDAKRTAFCR